MADVTPPPDPYRSSGPSPEPTAERSPAPVPPASPGPSSTPYQSYAPGQSYPSGQASTSSHVAPDQSSPYRPTPYASAGYSPAAEPPTGIAPGAPQPGTDGISIAALVTGVLMLGILPLVLGIVGLRRVNRSGRQGRGLAIAGTVLGAVSTLGWTLLTLIVVLVATDDETREIFRDGVQQTIDEANGLVVGNCLLLPADLTGNEAPTVVDCATPHDAEVYIKTVMTGEVYPGMDKVEDQAVEFCTQEFEGFTGVAYENEATLDVIYWFPVATSWRLGDRSIVCAVGSYDGSQLTGTAANSGQPLEQ